MSYVFGENPMTTLEKIEQDWKFPLPERHRQALLALSDPIYQACDFLVLESEHKLHRILDLNEWIHSQQVDDPWPKELLAFASNGCGDYFAYHLLGGGRYEIIYTDPDQTVEENLNKEDRSMQFDSFAAWYESTLPTR